MITARPANTITSLLLHQPIVRRFIGASLLSYTNQWVLRIGQDWLVLQLSGGSGVAIGVTTALQFAPSIGGSLWGGLLADKFPKARIMIAGELCTATVALTLGVLHATHSLAAWHIYLTALALGVSAGLATPARQTFVADVVESDSIAPAVSLVSTTFSVGRVLGPAGYGVMVAWLGTSAAFFACVLIGALVIANLVRLPSAREERAAVEVPETGWLDGVRFVRRRRELVVLLSVLIAVCALGWNSQVTIALMARNVFHEAATGYAFLGTLFAAGSIVGTVLVSRWHHPRTSHVLRAAIVFGLVSMVASVCPSVGWFGSLLVLLGTSSLVVATTASVTFQLAAPGYLRGRVVAVYLLVTSAATGAGAPLLGVIGQFAGPRWTYGICGLVVVTAAVTGAAAMHISSSRALVSAPATAPTTTTTAGPER